MIDTIVLEPLLAHSIELEDVLVRQNLRGMKTMQEHLTAGYLLRSARLINDQGGVVLIGTGFPVAGTFETDGPVGAMVLYRALEMCGYHPVIVCGAPLSGHLALHYRVYELIVGPHENREGEALHALEKLQPDLIISIERPGLSDDGHYYNMLGENISTRAACFDSFFDHATCPTLAIGDGGNEIGMGNIKDALTDLDIRPSRTSCSELVVADVSNWGALGIVAMLEILVAKPLLKHIDPIHYLKYLAERGSVDGVTHQNTLTEDGLSAEQGIRLLSDILTLNRKYKAQH